MIIHHLANALPLVKAVIVDPRGKHQVFHLVAVPTGIAADAKRPELRAQISGAGVFGRVRHGDIRRHLLLGAQLVRHDRAQAGMLNRRTLAIAGEHGIAGPAMIRLFAGDRTDDRHLVRDFGDVAEVFIQHDPLQIRLRHAEWPAIFQRRLWLGIPRFLMSHAPRQHDLNDAGGPPFFALVEFLVGASPQSEEVSQRQSQCPANADSQKVTAARLLKMSRIVSPGDGVVRHGGHSSSLSQKAMENGSVSQENQSTGIYPTGAPSSRSSTILENSTKSLFSFGLRLPSGSQFLEL